MCACQPHGTAPLFFFRRGRGGGIIIEVAGAEVLLPVDDVPLEHGLLVLAYFHALLATGVEMTALGWVDGVGHVALQHNAAALVVRVHHGDGGEEGLRVSCLLYTSRCV